MRTLRVGLGTALIAGLFAAGCGNSGPAPATGIASIKLGAPNPYGEIPYERNLRVDRYSMDRLKDVHTLQTGEVIATIYATFSRGADSETYEIEVTKESSRDAQILANNLSRYNVVTIPPTNNGNGKGDRTDGVRAVPTEHGVVYRMPASSLRFSDLETYTVTTKQREKTGTIDNEGVHRPWLSGNQQIEKPCIADEIYRSICATPAPTAPSTARPPSTAKPPAPVAPAKPVPQPAPSGKVDEDCNCVK